MADCKNCRKDWLKCKQQFLEHAIKTLKDCSGYENITINDFQEDAFESLYFNNECVSFRKKRNKEIQLIGFDNLLDKNILMMGAPFAGKSVLIEELEIYDYTAYGMGEYCRTHFAQTNKIERNPTALTLKMLKEAVSTFDLNKKFVIDNPIKNIKQYPILPYINKNYNFIILNVTRNFHQDLESRGRPDDIYLQDKIQHYNENMPQVLEKIKKSKFQFFTVENNGDNFKVLLG
jgi:hypothetical protein